MRYWGPWVVNPSPLLKMRNPPRLPVGLEIDPREADHPLSIKPLEDRLVESETPEVRGVKDVLLLRVVGEAAGDQVSELIFCFRIFPALKNGSFLGETSTRWPFFGFLPL